MIAPGEVQKFGKYRLTWREELPRTRTILVDEELYTLKFPRVVFLIVEKRYWKASAEWNEDEYIFAHLRAYFTLEPLGPGVKLYDPALPNISDNNCTVCLGSSKDRIWEGSIDPVDAFWNTSFEDDAYDDDWSKNGMIRLWRMDQIDGPPIIDRDRTPESVLRPFLAWLPAPTWHDAVVNFAVRFFYGETFRMIGAVWWLILICTGGSYVIKFLIKLFAYLSSLNI